MVLRLLPIVEEHPAMQQNALLRHRTTAAGASNAVCYSNTVVGGCNISDIATGRAEHAPSDDVMRHNLQHMYINLLC